jgi:hypothetical protein
MLRFRTPTGSIEALPQQEARVRGLSDTAVGADPSLSHRADRILSQGWKPTA